VTRRDIALVAVALAVMAVLGAGMGLL